MTLTTPDVIGLLALSAFALWLCWRMVHLHLVINDPDHPDHETAKEAVSEGEPRRLWEYPFD